MDKLRRLSTVLHYFRKRPPYDYQADFIDDLTGSYRAYKKARQIGISTVFGDKGALLASTIPNYNRIYVSMSLGDSKEKIAISRELHEIIKEECPNSVPELVIDNVTELKFSNGSRLISVFSPRGKTRADLDIDEFTFASDPMSIYEAATPILIMGGAFTIAGTPTTEDHLFEEIFSGKDGKYREFRRFKLHWYDCPIHCSNVFRARIEAPKMDTESRVQEFGTRVLKKLFDIMPLESFQQEFELKVLDDRLAWLSWNLIVRTTPTGAASVRACESLEELRAHAQGKRVFAGFDVGRRRNAAVLSVMVEETEGLLVERYLQKYEDTEFRDQEEELLSLLSHGNVWLNIDQTGMGEQLSENMHREHGDQATGVLFTGGGGGARSIIAASLKNQMEKNAVKFIYSREANYDMHSVRRSVSRLGQLSLIVETSKKTSGSKTVPHADIFWSRGLAVQKYRETVTDGEVNIMVVGD